MTSQSLMSKCGTSLSFLRFSSLSSRSLFLSSPDRCNGGSNRLDSTPPAACTRSANSGYIAISGDDMMLSPLGPPPPAPAFAPALDVAEDTQSRDFTTSSVTLSVCKKWAMGASPWIRCCVFSCFLESIAASKGASLFKNASALLFKYIFLFVFPAKFLMSAASSFCCRVNSSSTTFGLEMIPRMFPSSGLCMYSLEMAVFVLCSLLPK
mmetsp:Transcript_32433/g.60542  ORF Transcript_32433/g.60542 Transcript_32433/m.60542 type:complete len:209 (+) Transcript_32433:2689-3315(+)